MNANVNDAVLIYLQTGELLPVYRGALQSAEGWPWHIRKKYAGAVLIDEFGMVKKVDNVKVIGPLGNSLWSKVFSVLNSNWIVFLELTNALMSEDDIRKLIINGLALDKKAKFSKFFNLKDSFSEDLHNEKSFKEIFNYLCISNEQLEILADEDSSILLDTL